MAATKDLVIERGKTYSQILRWESLPIIYKAITGISKSGPVTLTVPGHGALMGWRAAVAGVTGMSDINAVYTPPKSSDYHLVTVVDTNTIQFNDVNSSLFAAYVSGGYLQYNTPVDLTGYSAQMVITDPSSGSVLQTLTSGNGDIVFDNVNKTITLGMNKTNTAAIAWASALYSLDMVKATGDPLNPTVTPFLYGGISAVNNL